MEARIDHNTVISSSQLRRSCATAIVASVAALAGCAAISQAKVLTEASFDDIKPGMSADQVLAQLGRPTWVFGAGWQDHYHVWNYRWAGADCVWFQISINDTDQRVKDASMAPDPKCDGPNSRDGR